MDSIKLIPPCQGATSAAAGELPGDPGR